MQPLVLDKLGPLIGHPLVYGKVKGLVDLVAPIVELGNVFENVTPVEYDQRLLEQPELLSDIGLLIKHLGDLANASLKLKAAVSTVESNVKRDRQARIAPGYVHP